MLLQTAAAKLSLGLRKIFPPKEPPFCSAVITAAGSGTRMGGVSKQLMELCGKKSVLYSLEAFGNSPYIKEIIITAKEDELEKMKETVGAGFEGKPVTVVTGGKTRQESVENAFWSTDKKCGCIAVHDAARPLLTTDDVNALFEAAFLYGAASAGYPIADSLKKVGADGLIKEDVDRDGLWAVQTPQVFLSDIYKVSLAVARRDSLKVTDDNSLVTHAGFSVRVINTGRKSFKLTVPEDVALIEAILEQRNADTEEAK